jgi:hypothetical protein
LAALHITVAEALELRLTGTLGWLLDAKHAGLVPAIAPLLDQLQALRFRLAPHTRLALLKLAQEGPVHSACWPFLFSQPPGVGIVSVVAMSP